MIDKLSIVIPVYNGEGTIAQLLDSIKKQDYCNYEVIIVNDGSTDKTKQVIEEFSLSDKRFKIINKKNEGVSVARNEGIKNACGDHLTFADADDYYSEGSFSKLVDFSKNSDNDVIMFAFQTLNQSNKLIEKNRLPYESNSILFKKQINTIIIPDLLYGKIRGVGWNIVVNLNTVNKKYFKNDLLFQEDLLFCVDLFSDISSLGIYNEILYNYVRTDVSVMERYRANFDKESKYASKLIRKVLEKKEFFELVEVKNSYAFYLAMSYVRCIGNYFKLNHPTKKIQKEGLLKLSLDLNNDKNIKTLSKASKKLKFKHKIQYRLLNYKFIGIILFIYKLKDIKK
ncbi:hypothetical protein A4S06_08455 [Erysipelotrichaceae bacterium MTC7]|nr:hypothetical protein A4S06_08455 [Erysipelotrichaceae bacterium MTC7]